MAKSRYFQKRSVGSGKSGRHRERTMSSLGTGEREGECVVTVEKPHPRMLLGGASAILVRVEHTLGPGDGHSASAFRIAVAWEARGTL